MRSNQASRDALFIFAHQDDEMAVFAHIDRMETETDYAHLGFPKRLQIGFRVFWVEEEVHAWVAAQIAKRDAS